MAGGFPPPSKAAGTGVCRGWGRCAEHLHEAQVDIWHGNALPAAQGKQAAPGGGQPRAPRSTWHPCSASVPVFESSLQSLKLWHQNHCHTFFFFFSHLPPQVRYFPCIDQMRQQQQGDPSCSPDSSKLHIPIGSRCSGSTRHGKSAIRLQQLKCSFTYQYPTSYPFHNDAVSKSGAHMNAHIQFLSTQKIAYFFSCQHALCNTQLVILVSNAAFREFAALVK